MIRYQLSKKENVERLFREYLLDIDTIFDSFFEDHMFSSTFYEIICNDKTIGYFAIYDKQLLTQFFMVNRYFYLAQTIFYEVINQYQIASAYVPSGDEKLIALCMDLCKRSELQAYFFEDSKRIVKEATYKKELLTVATIDDCEEIASRTGGFFDKLEKRIVNKEIYIFKDTDGHFIGYGIVVKSNLFEGYMEIGMYVLEEYRQKGVGRSIIIHLKNMVKKNKYKAIAGCWYHNHNSKKTLESAGLMATKRLIKFIFKEE